MKQKHGNESERRAVAGAPSQTSSKVIHLQPHYTTPVKAGAVGRFLAALWQWYQAAGELRNAGGGGL